MLKSDINLEAVQLPACFFHQASDLLVQQVINYLISKTHKGTKQQKSRSLISGGNSKPWAQKGTGRARASSTRSPHFRGGAVTFARVGSITRRQLKCNKKMYQSALAHLLSQRYASGMITIVDHIDVVSHKTKDSMHLNGTFYLTHDELSPNLVLSTRNRMNVHLVCSLCPLDLIKSKHLTITKHALSGLTQYLQTIC